MHSPKEFVNTLEDVIRKRGAMDKLIMPLTAVLMRSANAPMIFYVPLSFPTGKVNPLSVSTPCRTLLAGCQMCHPPYDGHFQRPP
jgi:hypothetical protein